MPRISVARRSSSNGAWERRPGKDTALPRRAVARTGCDTRPPIDGPRGIGDGPAFALCVLALAGAVVAIVGLVHLLPLIARLVS